MYHQIPGPGQRSPVDRWMRHDRFSRFGLWRAEVLNTEDPEFRGRIQVRVLHLHPPSLQPAATGGEGAAKSDILVQANTTGATAFEGVPPDSCPWAEPCFPFGGKKSFNSGFIMTPYVGSTVWVAFEMGFSGRPVWFGSWLGKDEIPDEIATATDMENIRLIRTEFGHLLLMDDTDGAERCLLGVVPTTGDRVRFLEFDEANKQVRLFNDPDGAGTGTGTRVYMTEDELILSKGDPANATVITMNSDKIEIKCETSIVTINKSGDISIVAAGKVVSQSTGATEVTAGAGLTINVTGNASIQASGNIQAQATGNATITAGGAAAVNATGAATVAGVAGTNLGGPGGQGVCLDSLIAVIATAYGIFNAHTHSGVTGGPGNTGPPSAVMVPPVVGVNSSVLVKSTL